MSHFINFRNLNFIPLLFILNTIFNIVGLNFLKSGFWILDSNIDSCQTKHTDNIVLFIIRLQHPLVLLLTINSKKLPFVYRIYQLLSLRPSLRPQRDLVKNSVHFGCQKQLKYLSIQCKKTQDIIIKQLLLNLSLTCKQDYPFLLRFI